MTPPLVIAGGGPAGMMAGLLFARAGVKTLVLEKHDDFLRDFRGDTVHPSTLQLFDELGLLRGLLERPHDQVTTLSARAGGRQFQVADFRRLPVGARFIALMPQWDFLDFLADEARKLPAFSLRMGCEATGLVEQDGRVTGVVTAGGETIAAGLVIAADGRKSVLRAEARLPLVDLGAPIDVLWFRVPKPRTAANETTGIFDAGRIVVLIDRGDYWQCAFVVRKGGAEAVMAAGIAAFRAAILKAAPELGGGIDAVRDWDAVKLLNVSLDRLARWHRPGLLAIGDAAHAMSPVGGVGINLAIQDAVAAANILAEPMAQGRAVDPLLGRVQARRMLPTRLVQRLQRIAHNRFIGPALAADAPVKPPLALRLIDRFSPLQALPAYIVGLGVRREHIRSPRA
ncbi:MAG: monooxygenase [Sphingomonas sp. SCN 67-18]|uniref:FAD-dependent oxidoreductase n=1 Tax=uncultured Sphingomonas sp. TaxID=158754 RepID=UPI00086EF07D|nr:FAD-dependent oxidoreductase [Sphingomonas sp. SCN 67-18]ODU20901.1 MAG: monooxygenase [Sphingomonas sp. SCN 67-18]